MPARRNALYTVIGVYRSPLGQRFAMTVEAGDGPDAERQACEAAGGELIIAGVVEGIAALVDHLYTDGVSRTTNPAE